MHCEGCRGLRGSRFLVMSTATLVPVGLWIIAVFLRTANPVASGWSGDGRAMPYLVFQAPRVLLSPAFYSGFILRFLVRDCGPVMPALVVLGVVAAVRRRRDASEGRPALQPLICWSVMGLAFYVVFAPKLIDHHYYELMLLPAAATWGALGLSRLVERVGADTRPACRRPARGARAGGGCPVAVVHVGHVPDRSREVDRGRAAQGLDRRGPSGRGDRARDRAGHRHSLLRPRGVVGCGCSVSRTDWPARIESFRAARAQALAVYFDPKAPARARRSLEVLAHNLPVVERGTVPWSRTDGTCSYRILDLR